MEEIERARNGEKIICIGYRLPDIRIEGEIKGEVYFNQTIFQMADFSEAVIHRTHFGSAEFQGEAKQILAVRSDTS